jgi:hypothetical protein
MKLIQINGLNSGLIYRRPSPFGHLVFVEGGETAAQAIHRYQRDHGKVIEADDMVHVVSFADPLG